MVSERADHCAQQSYYAHKNEVYFNRVFTNEVLVDESNSNNTEDIYNDAADKTFNRLFRADDGSELVFAEKSSAEICTRVGKPRCRTTKEQ